jgi:hypothetical protein
MYMQGCFIVEFLSNRLINICRNCHGGKDDSFRLASWFGGSRLRGNDGVYTGGCHHPLIQFLKQSAGINRMSVNRSKRLSNFLETQFIKHQFGLELIDLILSLPAK